MRIENDIKLDFNDVLIRPKRSTLQSRRDVTLERTYTTLHGSVWAGIPIVAAAMDGVGTLSMSKTLSEYKMITCLTRSIDREDLKYFFNVSHRDKDCINNIAVSIGQNIDDLNFIERSLQLPNVAMINIDAANGYSQEYANFVAIVRKRFPNALIITGNVVTADMTEHLLLSGADVVRVGIGNGAACTTRLKTGVGYPQLSAVIECADAAHGLGGLVMADGGCTTPGDIAKAFAAGADFVMLGSMLAGHAESDLPIQYNNRNEPVLDFYGMSSRTANERHFGGLSDYRTAEGRETLIPYKGDVKNTIGDILGGLRSTCTYVGARTLKELSKRTTFVRCNHQYNNSIERYTV